MSLLIFLVKIKEGHNLKVLRREKNGHDHENFEISQNQNTSGVKML